MASLFSQIGSGQVLKFVGYVRNIRPARGDDFAGYSDLGVSVNTAAGVRGEYAPSVFISVHTNDNSIEVGDKVLIEGLLTSRENEGKTYYSLNRYTLFPTIVLEKGKPKSSNSGTSPSSAPAAEATSSQSTYDDDF